MNFLSSFLLNAMMASGGYPWPVIPVVERARYLAALESASVKQDIMTFADFIAELVARREGS